MSHVLETYADRLLKFMTSAILSDSTSAGSDVCTQADTPFRPIVTSRGDAASKVSDAAEIWPPRPGAATDPSLAIQPYDITLRKEAVVDIRSVVRGRVSLKGRFVVIVTVVGLLGLEYVAHHRLSAVDRVSMLPPSHVHSDGPPTNVWSNSGASLEAQSVIEGWFILPEMPGSITATSITPPIGTLLVFPGQRSISDPRIGNRGRFN